MVVVRPWKLPSHTTMRARSGFTPFTFIITRTNSSAAASVVYSVAGSGANPASAADFGVISADPNSTVLSGTVNFAAGAAVGERGGVRAAFSDAMDAILRTG